MSGRIVIQGIGGIGGVVAGALIEAGMRPVLVTNNAELSFRTNVRNLGEHTDFGVFQIPHVRSE